MNQLYFFFEMAIELIHLTSLQITSNYQNIKTEKNGVSDGKWDSDLIGQIFGSFATYDEVELDLDSDDSRVQYSLGKKVGFL